jgi:ketosteroid isomerase-like protein
MATQVPETVRRYFDAVNGEDWDTLATLLHADAELRAVGARPRTGRDEVMTYYFGVFDEWEEHDDRPTRFLVDGDSVVAEIAFEGKTRGGTPVTFDAVDVFDLQDGLVRRLSSWYDIARVRALLAAERA